MTDKNTREIGKAEVELSDNITLLWSVKGVGFGEFRFYEKNGRVHCLNETMSKDFIKKVLCDMVDNCILDDPPRKK